MTASDSTGVAASPKREKRANQALGIEVEVAVLQQMTVKSGHGGLLGTRGKMW